MLTEVLYGQGENVRPHDGIKQPHADHHPQRHIAARCHRDYQQCHNDEGKNQQCSSRLGFSNDKPEVLEGKEQNERSYVAEGKGLAAFNAFEIHDAVNEQIRGNRGHKHFYIH